MAESCYVWNIFMNQERLQRLLAITVTQLNVTLIPLGHHGTISLRGPRGITSIGAPLHREVYVSEMEDEKKPTPLPYIMTAISPGHLW